ncbi:Oidioi.mRNA.OKI2018_I69.chr2.g8276.t1.cds [Oikopleura dioica]|uniref:Oidioi.mRNA.OKI2018_I69.chr2.g8276.t1.cds n=1 Tax=Oikopleura dioica TaxID=34765 RepID=A0ABN7TBX6_OIKDI|nr:Oidioi.mRNA.OKI2018_I69.chr2.g8276.t1.cds [Oikopleura dioica]
MRLRLSRERFNEFPLAQSNWDRLSHVSVEYSVASESGHSLHQSLHLSRPIPTLQLRRERDISVQRSLNVPFSDGATPRRNARNSAYWNKDYINRPSEAKMTKRYRQYFAVPKLKPIYPTKTPVPPRESTINFLKRLNL